MIVWQKAHKCVLKTYKFTAHFPKEEIYVLTSQFRRAAISIAANIAEGFKKWSLPDKNRILNIAQGSLEECRYYCILARDLEYGETQQLKDAFDEVGRLLYAYTESIKNRRQR